MSLNIQKLEGALKQAEQRLVNAYHKDQSCWIGELSSSALSTAVAVYALSVCDAKRYQNQITQGLQWLMEHINEDGGYGDTIDSPSNLSTTLLVWAASSQGIKEIERKTQTWVDQHCGDCHAETILKKLDAIYNNDRSFSAPILSMLAMSGKLGDPNQAWTYVPQLPFELAKFPRKLFKSLKLDVVSYALPALIAIGISKHSKHKKLYSPLTWIRQALRTSVLEFLKSIQPDNGGFLEATPLTAFVAMNLHQSGFEKHPVTQKCIDFLIDSQRSDGSWPIDTNLSTWVTSLSVAALDGLEEQMGQEPIQALHKHYLKHQLKQEHPYTGAAPGGWAWTSLAGAVPDADDTSGALLALKKLSRERSRDSQVALKGIKWLMDLQNKDGGIPTFCRGWGKLPFDKSCPDISAHALKAFGAWIDEIDQKQRPSVEQSMQRILNYLKQTQEPDGSWHPLWFGNQLSPKQINQCFGTAQVLNAIDPNTTFGKALSPQIQKASACLLKAQNEDGSWGGNRGVQGSIEETSLVLSALCKHTCQPHVIEKACAWLLQKTEGGRRFDSTPIGLYFASLWYSEKLYPLVFFIPAMRNAVTQLKNNICEISA